MPLLLNKLPAPVEFNHDGQTIKLPSGEQVYCPKDLLKALSMYPAVRAYFDEGKIDLDFNDEEAAAAGEQAQEKPLPPAAEVPAEDKKPKSKKQK